MLGRGKKISLQILHSIVVVMVKEGLGWIVLLTVDMLKTCDIDHCETN